MVVKSGFGVKIGIFCLDNHPVISYAASFGVSEIDNEEARVYFENIYLS